MAVEVVCRACRHTAFFLASDLLPIVQTEIFEDLWFRCSRCESDRCRAYPRRIEKTPTGSSSFDHGLFADRVEVK